MPKCVNVSLKLQGFDGDFRCVKKFEKRLNHRQRFYDSTALICKKQKKLRCLRKNEKPLLEKFSAHVKMNE